MPIHDWTRVSDGTFHDLHHVWIANLRSALNDGLLPRDYYAQCEQVAGGAGPDVLTLQSPPMNGPTWPAAGGGGVATLAPPQATFTFRAQVDEYTTRQKSVIIRHASGHRVVAIIEIVSPGNKSSEYAFDQVVNKIAAAFRHGVHALVVDLFPPTPRDPNGIHAAIWEAVRAGTFRPPEDRPLTLASYDAGPLKTAYVEPARPGDLLRPMPLILESPDFHIAAPLEETYTAAYRGVPAFYREILERSA